MIQLIINLWQTTRYHRNCPSLVLLFQPSGWLFGPKKTLWRTFFWPRGRGETFGVETCQLTELSANFLWYPVISSNSIQLEMIPKVISKSDFQSDFQFFVIISQTSKVISKISTWCGNLRAAAAVIQIPPTQKGMVKYTTGIKMSGKPGRVFGRISRS